MISVTCFRLFQNRFGYNDYERHYEWDEEFETADDAIGYMHERCGDTSMGEIFVFDVIVKGRGWKPA